MWDSHSSASRRPPATPSVDACSQSHEQLRIDGLRPGGVLARLDRFFERREIERLNHRPNGPHRMIQRQQIIKAAIPHLRLAPPGRSHPHSPGSRILPMESDTVAGARSSIPGSATSLFMHAFFPPRTPDRVKVFIPKLIGREPPAVASLLLILGWGRRIFCRKTGALRANRTYCSGATARYAKK